MDKFYYAGVFAGIAIALAISIILYLIKKKKHTAEEFDERQQLARGKAYRNGYVTTSFYLCAYGILEGLGIVWCEPMIGCIIGVMLGAAVTSLTAIKNDAYISMVDSVRKTCFVSVAFILGMIALFVVELLEGERLIADGKLTEGAAGLVIAIFWTVILAAVLVHSRNAKKQEAAEEEA